jgi:hypothetical protein
MITDLNQRLDNMIESIDIIVMQDQVPQFISLAISLAIEFGILSGNISAHGLLLRNAKIKIFIHNWRAPVNKVPLCGQIQ